MAYIDPHLLDMARSQAVAKRDKKELPYKPPYKYKASDGEERVVDTEWFDKFTDDFLKQTPERLSTTAVNEQPKLS